MGHESVRRQAEHIAERLPVGYSLDPVLIITILTQVLPLLWNCGRDNASPKPEDIRDYIAKEHARHPVSLRRRVARRIRGESDTDMTKAQSLIIAEAVIAEALTPSDTDEQLVEFGSACQAIEAAIG